MSKRNPHFILDGKKTEIEAYKDAHEKNIRECPEHAHKHPFTVLNDMQK